MNEKLLSELSKAVEEQIQTGNPKETKPTYQKLLSRGMSSRKAKEKIAEVIYHESICIISTQMPFNRARYVRNLELMLEGKPLIK